jgi:hypothetical protein
MAYRLTEYALSTLKDDNDLLKDTANALKVSLLTLPSMIHRNNRRLNDISVAMLISKKTGKRVEDLIEEENAEENETVSTTK